MDENNEIDYKQILNNKKFTLCFKRFFDICASTFGIIVLSPLFLVVSILIAATSKGGVFFKQTRIGKDGKEFKIIKFRSMERNAEAKGLQITVGEDMRVTSIGKIIRKTKIDELPQLFNVFIGDMSFVGPRPEVPKYVNMYDDIQKNVLLVRPGITELASIIYRDENEVLSKSDNPERTYIEEIMPRKLNTNLEYITKINFFYDLGLIFKTFLAILR